MTIKLRHRVRVFVVPTKLPLGSDEKDYSNVQVKVLDISTEETTQAEPHEVAFFSTGRLGALNGGLLHIVDSRQIMTAEDISAAQANLFRKAVATREAQAQQQQQKIDLKRKRSQEKTDWYSERVQTLQEKVANIAIEATAWKTIWTHFSKGEDRVQKKEGQGWDAYLLELTGNDKTVEDTCPASLESAALPFEDALMVVAGLVSQINGRKKDLEGSLERAKTIQAKLIAHGEYSQKKAEEKIAKLLDPDTKDKDLKLGAEKLPVHPMIVPRSISLSLVVVNMAMREPFLCITIMMSLRFHTQCSCTQLLC